MAMNQGRRVRNDKCFEVRTVISETRDEHGLFTITHQPVLAGFLEESDRRDGRRHPIKQSQKIGRSRRN